MNALEQSENDTSLAKRYFEDNEKVVEEIEYDIQDLDKLKKATYEFAGEADEFVNKITDIINGLDDGGDDDDYAEI